MTTYNCTYETLPAYENSLAINLPSKIAARVHDLIVNQSYSPLVKADRLIYILDGAKIKPNTGVTLYVGNGQSNVGGFSKFRQELRRRGFNVITKLAIKQKRLVRDNIVIDGELLKLIQDSFKVSLECFLGLTTRDLERKRDTVVIKQDLGFTYQVNPDLENRTPWVAPLINGVILVRDSLKRQYYLGFSEGKLKYVTNELNLDSILYKEKDEGSILEIESNGVGKVHQFNDESFRSVFVKFFTLSKRTNKA